MGTDYRNKQNVRLYFGEVEHTAELTLKCKHRICFVTAPWGQHLQLVSWSNDKNHGPRRLFWQWNDHFTSSTNRIIGPDSHKQYIFVLRTWAPHTHTHIHTHTQGQMVQARQEHQDHKPTWFIWLLTYFQRRHLGMRDSADRQKHWLTDRQWY